MPNYTENEAKLSLALPSLHCAAKVPWHFLVNECVRRLTQTATTHSNFLKLFKTQNMMKKLAVLLISCNIFNDITYIFVVCIMQSELQLQLNVAVAVAVAVAAAALHTQTCACSKESGSNSDSLVI